MTASLSRTVIRGISGTVDRGVWRVECRYDGSVVYWDEAERSWVDAWHAARVHRAGDLHRLLCENGPIRCPDECACEDCSPVPDWEAEAVVWADEPLPWEDLLPARTVRPRRFRHLATTLTAGIRGGA